MLSAASQHEPLRKIGQAQYGVLLLVSLWCHGLGVFLAGLCWNSHPSGPTFELPLRAIPPTSHSALRQLTSVTAHSARPVPSSFPSPRPCHRQPQGPRTTWSTRDNAEGATASNDYNRLEFQPADLNTAVDLGRFLHGVSVLFRLLLGPCGLSDITRRLPRHWSLIATWQSSIQGRAQCLGLGLLATATAVVAGVTWGGPGLRYSACETRMGSGVEAMSLVHSTPVWEYFASGGYAHWVVRALACADTAALASGSARLGLPTDGGSGSSCHRSTRDCHVATTVAVCALLLQAVILHVAALIQWRTMLSLARHM